MIGIIDYEFMVSKRGLPPPSLDAMKFATYLRKELKQQVSLLNSFDTIENYEKVYFFSNLILEKLPKEIFTYPNVELYGQYLNQIPIIAQHMIPDITIYNNAIDLRMADGSVSVNRVLQFMGSSYYKSADSNNNRLPLPPIEKNKRFYIYDEDFLSNPECWNILDEISGHSPSTVISIEPIHCHNLKQFFTLRKDYEIVSRNNKIILDFFVPLHHFGTYFGNYKLKLLGEITKSSRVYIYFGKNYSNKVYNETFYLRNLFYCLNLLFSYYSRNIPIRVEQYYPLDASNPLEDFYKQIRTWANSDDYDKKLSEAFNSNKLKEKLQEFIRNNPTFEPFFNKSKNDLIHTRGAWRIP